jgi:excisionase family DNA binding protein
MQGYSIAEKALSPQLHLVERDPAVIGPASSHSNTVVDQLLMHLADLVAERVAARLVAPPQASGVEWLDTRRAAEYLGIGRDSLRRLAAERSIPTEQAGAGCKLYFRRSDLDTWRCSGSVPARGTQERRHG